MSSRVERERAEAVLPWGSANLGRQINRSDPTLRSTLLDPEDPILRLLSRDPTREYVRVGYEPPVAAAWLQLTTAVRSAPLDLLPASARRERGATPTRAQRRVFEVIRGAIDRTPYWSTVLDLCLDAVAWGWRPFEITYVRDLRVMGSTYWRPRLIEDRDPWHFRFNIFGDPGFYGVGVLEQVLDTEEDRNRWWMPRSGSIACPYGLGRFQRVWLPAYLRSKMLERWSSAIQRIAGVYRVRQRSSGVATSLTRPQERAIAAKTVQELANEARLVVEVLDKTGVLVERSDVEGDFLTNILADGASFEQAVTYFDRMIRTALLGQDLTAAAAENTSSRSANETARKAMLDVARGVAEQLEQIVDGLVGILGRINFGLDVDPGDLPYHRSGLRRVPALDSARQLWDMGAAIDGAALAEELGVVLADPEASGALVKAQSASVAAAVTPATAPIAQPADAPSGEPVTLTGG